MRRILIDNARRKHALRHGGGQATAWTFQELEIAAPAADDQLLAINEALDKLAAQDKTEGRTGEAAIFCRYDD